MPCSAASLLRKWAPTPAPATDNSLDWMAVGLAPFIILVLTPICNWGDRSTEFMLWLLFGTPATVASFGLLRRLPLGVGKGLAALAALGWGWGYAVNVVIPATGLIGHTLRYHVFA